MTDDNGDLANEQIERERRKIFGSKGSDESGGASIQMNDRRVSKAIQWFWGFVGMAIVTGIYWVAASINTLNVNLERALVRMDYTDKRTDLNEAEIRQLQKDVAELQGKVYRGGTLADGL